MKDTMEWIWIAGMMVLGFWIFNDASRDFIVNDGGFEHNGKQYKCEVKK